MRGYEKKQKTLNVYIHVKHWFKTIEARPGGQRGVQLLINEREASTKVGITDKVREIHFGDVQHQRR
jgi:hypothetical protein